MLPEFARTRLLLIALFLVLSCSISPRAQAGTAIDSSKVGLLVCDSIPARPSLRSFGAGCGRWLHLMASGQPEIGRTPIWASLDRVQNEMGRKDLALTLQQALPLQNTLGITHVAIGSIQGTSSNCTLTYKIYSLSNQKTIGSPIQCKGSEAAIVAALTKMAQEMDTDLGVSKPILPKAVSMTPAELSMIGALSYGSHLDATEIQSLAKLIPHAPLAGIFFLSSYGNQDQSLRDNTMLWLFNEQPKNPIVIHCLSTEKGEVLHPYVAVMEGLSDQYPQNYLFAHAKTWTQRWWGTRDQEYQAATRALSDAPNNPDAWLNLANVWGNMAQDLRKGRLASKISDEEWDKLNPMYGQWETDCAQAIRLDPKFGRAWYHLAEAATFYGDSVRADDAFWKALRLDPNHREVYWWGLEMFQPKWNDEPDALRKIAVVAASDHYDSAEDANNIAQELEDAGFDDLANGLANRYPTP